MNSPDKPQPAYFDSLPVQKSASIFRNTLASVLAEESPFANAPFVTLIAEKYLEDKNQLNYFTTNEGFGANIIVCDGVAQPNIDLNIQEGLKSRNLRQRIIIRLGKENLTNEEIFQFAVGHEIGHLIQGLADYASIEDQDLTGLNETQINEMRHQIDTYNYFVRSNVEINNAQNYFQSIFNDDIARDENEAYIDASHYTNEEYLKYVNSQTETNADFISLWIMGMINPSMKTSPQNEGYNLDDWRKWADGHRIDNLSHQGSHHELYNDDESNLVFRYYDIDKIFVKIGKRSYGQKIKKENWYSQESIQKFRRYFSV